ncbi:MAG: hypothetical protein LBB40_03260 [Holophagales bacterium]|nr:hypothetical protein [Holophagales bacterium]
MVWTRIMDALWINRNRHSAPVSELLREIQRLKNENAHLTTERDIYKEQCGELLTRLREAQNGKIFE